VKTIDLGAAIVVYNLIIGVLLMLAGDKIAAYAGAFSGTGRATVTRLTRTSIRTLGACIAFVSGSIYIVFHVLRIGV
jgi:hypothetical protein